MTDTLDIVSLVCEIVTWVTLLPGVVLLVVGIVMGALARDWHSASGVVVPSGADAQQRSFRWIDHLGDLHDSPADTEAVDRAAEGDAITVYFNPRRPHVGRTEPLRAVGRVPRNLGWVLLAIGMVAAAVSFALLFVG